MNKNLIKPFLLTLMVVAILLGMFFIPRLSLGDTRLRRVDILSDVQRKDSEGNIIAEVKADSAEGIVQAKLDTAAVKVEKPKFKDKIPDGMVAIEDFADSTGVNREMDKFYKALNSVGSRPVRIAYFGDSYIEGDILTQDLRNLLQTKYGGCGVGFVDIMSLTSSFRQTIIHASTGWDDHSANDKSGFNKELQGFNCRYFIPSEGATVELKGQKRIFPGKLDSMEIATVYFSPSGNLNLAVSVNGGVPDTLYAGNDTVDSGSGAILAESVEGRIGQFSMSVSGGLKSRFYGVALESKRGVILDNLSMRGSNGWQLSNVPQSTLQTFARLRPYDMIVLQYGLNVASPKTKDYGYYTKRLALAIRHIRKAYPDASILIVGVGDRDKRNAQGELCTMDGVKELVSYQRKLAADEKIAFWNLFDAMGGEGSIAKMKEKKQANLDYTHINFAGGKHLANLFFNVLVNGKQNYDLRSN